MQSFHIDPKLKEWATEKQAEYIDAINLHGGGRAAAKALGVDNSNIFHAIARLKKKAASKGYSPDHEMTRTVPDPFIVKGVSTYFNKDGKPTGQWVKSAIDPDKYSEMIKAAVEAMTVDIPRLPALAKPITVNEDLCNVHTFTDCHMGMLAWHLEAGANWDIKIAKKTLVGCFEQSIASAPAAKVGIIAQLGDWNHYDSLMPVTPTHGHIVDADGRFSKMVGATIWTLRRIVDLALLRYEQVIVLMAEGNHDMASSVWLRHMFKALYENEPRVTVIDTEVPYYAFQWGKTMLAWHHGHLVKNERLPGIFAAMYAKMWGDTTKRYAHAGHRHHVEEKEHPGMKVVQHPTLAAKDAHAARGGWLSERETTVITYHREFGQVGRTTVTPEMLEAA